MMPSTSILSIGISRRHGGRFGQHCIDLLWRAGFHDQPCHSTKQQHNLEKHDPKEVRIRRCLPDTLDERIVAIKPVEVKLLVQSALGRVKEAQIAYSNMKAG